MLQCVLCVYPPAVVVAAVGSFVSSGFATATVENATITNGTWINIFFILIFTLQGAAAYVCVSLSACWSVCGGAGCSSGFICALSLRHHAGQFRFTANDFLLRSSAAQWQQIGKTSGRGTKIDCIQKIKYSSLPHHFAFHPVSHFHLPISHSWFQSGCVFLFFKDYSALCEWVDVQICPKLVK